MGIAKDKITEEMKKEIERLRQFTSRNRFDARMNSTKWRAAIDAVSALEGYAPAFRIKAVTDLVDPATGAWDAAFPGNIPLYNSIEWLELHPSGAAAIGAGAGAHAGGNPGGNSGGKIKRADFRAALRQALEAAGIPIEDAATGIRIIGYVRQGKK